MHEALRKIFDALRNDVTDLHLRWEIFTQLFCGPRENVDLMNESGSNVFYLLQALIVDDVALRLSKYTDPAAQRAFENLSVRRLLDEVAKSTRPMAKEEPDRLLSTLDGAVAKFRTWRNKRIAHADLAHALKIDGATLPGITVGEINEALAALRELLNAIELHFDSSQTAYEMVILDYGSDGNKLVSVLKKAHGGAACNNALERERGQ